MSSLPLHPSSPHKSLPPISILQHCQGSLTLFPILSSLVTMDPIKTEKLRAMKIYRGKQFLPTFIQYSLSTLMLALFLSSPSWLPSLCSTVKFFFSVSLPKIGAIVFGPKCLFIVSNIIIIFLVSESKFLKSPATPDIYDEYVERRQSLQSPPTGEVKEEEAVEEFSLVEATEEKADEVQEEEGEEEKEEEDEEEKEEEEKEQEEGSCGEGEEVDRDSKELEGEEEKGLPAEELNRRVEDFIAKVNMQRRLEARMVLCYG